MRDMKTLISETPRNPIVADDQIAAINAAQRTKVTS
jgi:hypothetical protein